MSLHRTVALTAIAATIATAGCGSAATGTHHAPARRRTNATTLPGPCSPQARTALATALGTSSRAITTHPFTPPSGVQACRFTALDLTVVATIDPAPQAYQVFNRTTVEYAQNVIWAHLGAKAYPVTILHLGLDADWIPPQHEVITTDGVRLITVTITTLPAHTSQPEQVGARLANTYLGPLHNPYPS